MKAWLMVLVQCNYSPLWDLSSFKFMPLQLLGGLVKKITEGNNSKTMEARVTVVVHCNSL